MGGHMMHGTHITLDDGRMQGQLDKVLLQCMAAQLNKIVSGPLTLHWVLLWAGRNEVASVRHLQQLCQGLHTHTGSGPVRASVHVCTPLDCPSLIMSVVKRSLPALCFLPTLCYRELVQRTVTTPAHDCCGCLT